MLQPFVAEAAENLKKDWDLQLPDMISEESIINELANRIVILIERNPEEFFQLMYRLDVSEKRLNAVLQMDDVAFRIARLVYERQLQKIETKEYFKKTPVAEDPELQW